MNKAFDKLAKNRLVQNSDLILFTGDITDTGHIDEWTVFWETLRNRDLTHKCVIVPGNHDLCCLGARMPKKKRELVTDDIKKLNAGLLLGSMSPKRYPWVWKANNLAAVFCVDSCNKGNMTGVTNGMGKIGFHQLEKLARQLYHHRDTKVKIVALHHSPNIPGNRTAVNRGIEHMTGVERWGMEVPSEERRALRLLCVTHRVRMVVHGHLHRVEDRRINGVRFIGAPASTEPMDDKYWFYTYEIQGNGGRVLPRLNSVE